jgi:hypothetical protein
MLAGALNIPLLTCIEEEETRFLGVYDAADMALVAKHRVQVLSKLIGEEERLGRFVTDLTTLDCLAEWKSGLSRYDSRAGRAYEAACMAKIDKYDLMVYDPGDGVENAILKELLERYSRRVPVIIVQGDLKNKVQQVLSHLRITKGAAAL